MAEATRLEDALDRLRVSTMNVKAPVSVEKNLLDAFRENAARQDPAIWLGFPWKLVGVSMATVVLVVTSALLYSKLRPDAASREATNSNASEGAISSRVVPETSSMAALPIDPSRKPGTEHTRSTSGHHFAEAHSKVTERGSGTSVVQANDVLSLNGGGSVVRVTLPVSSLVAMGVPVRPDLSESRVTADIWMDPFGSVMGVRLVPPHSSAD
jgi:hypothetical protein